MIDEADVTLGDFIKAHAAGRVTENGPLFRIEAEAVHSLFAKPRKHELR